MKICFITATMAGGGAERVIANLSNELVKRGHDVTILLTTEYVIEYELDSNVRVVQVSAKTAHDSRKRLQRIWALRKYLKQNRDAYFISMPTDTNIYVLLASLFLKINLTISERNDPNAYENKKLRDIAYILAKKVVFQTPDAKQYFCKRIQKLSTIIPNPVSSNIQVQETIKRRKRVVAVGRLDEQKNHWLLIDAFELFLKEYPEYELYIYGKGNLQEELMQYIQQKNMQSKIVLAGFSKNVWEEVADCAMYVLPSDYEGMPNSLLEAMAVGMPVIATDCPIGGPRMLIEHEKNGLLVPVGDKEKLYLAMRCLEADEAFSKTLADNAAKIKITLSVENICDKWLDYIKG